MEKVSVSLPSAYSAGPCDTPTRLPRPTGRLKRPVALQRIRREPPKPWSRTAVYFRLDPTPVASSSQYWKPASRSRSRNSNPRHEASVSHF